MSITKAIQEVLTKLKRVELAKKRMNNLLEQVDWAQKELEQLGRILDKEYKDVLRLEQMSLRNLFITVLGDKDTQIETERQEYLQAFLHYKERKRMIELLLTEQE